MQLKLTTLIENNPSENNELCYEHGFSVLIETPKNRYIFDTGQSGKEVDNIHTMGISMEKIDGIILSHGHYDHTGGLQNLLKNYPGIHNIIVGKEFFRGKYKILQDGSYKYNGNGFLEQDLLNQRMQIQKIDQEIQYITEEIILFHGFSQSNNYEQVNPKFVYKEEDQYYLDEFQDEIVAGVITSKGLVVIVGCAHPGIINILESIQKKSGLNIYGVVGGTHLIDANEERIKWTLEKIKSLDIQLIGLSHCTGEKGIQKIQMEFPDKFLYNNTGNQIIIQ